MTFQNPEIKVLTCPCFLRFFIQFYVFCEIISAQSVDGRKWENSEKKHLSHPQF